MLKQRVPLWLAFPIIFALGATFYRLDDRASEASLTQKPKVWSNEECLSCHTNERVLRQMQSKRGDSTYCQAAYDRLIKVQGTKAGQSYVPTGK